GGGARGGGAARPGHLGGGGPPLPPLGAVGDRRADARLGPGGAAPRAGALPRSTAGRRRRLLRRLARERDLRPRRRRRRAAGPPVHPGAELGGPANLARAPARPGLPLLDRQPAPPP